MDILSVAQSALQRMGLNAPTSLIGSPDQTAIQSLALISEVCGKIIAHRQWQSITGNISITCVAGNDQGDVSTLIPDLNYIINSTLFNQTANQYLYGSVSPQATQYAASFANGIGVTPIYAIEGGKLFIYPAGVAGQILTGKYIISAIGTDSAGAFITAFTSDTDMVIIDDELAILGLMVRFKQAKGLDFSVEKNNYDARMRERGIRDAPPPVLNMGRIAPDILYTCFPENGFGL